MRILLLSAGIVAGLAAGIGWIAAAEDNAEESDAAPDRDQIRREMTARASAIRIVPLEGKDKSPAALRTEPVMQYTDQPRRIIDATLWIWTLEGRPAALCKIEHYGYPEEEKKWLYCLASLDTDRIDFVSPAGRRWQSQEAGLQLKTLPDGPTPAAGKAARLRQIKELSRRFSATMIDNVAGSRQEMRLLSQPLVRYGDDKSDLIDGALFGLTSNGTNPDALFAVEVHRAMQGESVWKFGVTGLTDGALSVRLDKTEVWSKAQGINISEHATWTYFWESEFSKPE